MTDVRPEKLGDLQQVIRVVTSTGAVYFQEDPSLQDFNFCFAYMYNGTPKSRLLEKRTYLTFRTLCFVQSRIKV